MWRPVSDSFDLDAYFEVELAYTEYNAKRVLRADEPALEVRRRGRVIAVRDANRPDGYYNRVFGPIQVDSPGVAELHTWVEESGADCVVETLVDPNATPAAPAGWSLQSEKLILELSHRHAFDPKLLAGAAIRRALPQDLDRVFELWQDGRPLELDAETLERRKLEQMDPRFPIFLLTQHGTTIAMATSFISHNQVWLGNANTARSHRRMGAHAALVAHRVVHARNINAHSTLVDLEPNGASHQSVLKLGFEPLLRLQVLTKP